MGRMLRRLPGAGGGVQIRTGLVVRAFEAFIRMRQPETDNAEQQEQQLLEEGA